LHYSIKIAKLERNHERECALPPRHVPTYALYGEFLSGGQTEELHYEPLHERSSKHGWDIKLHRHKDLAQIFLFRTRNVFIQVDDIEFQTTQTTAVFVPPMVTHAFRFPAGTIGDVISLPIKSARDAQSAVILTATASQNVEQIAQLVAQIGIAYKSLNVDRSALLSHLVQALLIYMRAATPLIENYSPLLSATDMTKHEMQAHAFCVLIERNFASAKSIEVYAKDLGVSAPHLTRVSKKVLGASPNELITRRRMIEAERLLKFTQHAVADVAMRAGYSDPPYFNRMFKRRHGMTPGAFRKLRVP
jgi:AraC family transcriptional activator of pobA